MNHVVTTQPMALRQRSRFVNQGFTGFDAEVAPPILIQASDDPSMRRGGTAHVRAACAPTQRVSRCGPRPTWQPARRRPRPDDTSTTPLRRGTASRERSYPGPDSPPVLDHRAGHRAPRSFRRPRRPRGFPAVPGSDSFTNHGLDLPLRGIRGRAREDGDQLSALGDGDGSPRPAVPTDQGKPGCSEVRRAHPAVEAPGRLESPRG